MFKKITIKSDERGLLFQKGSYHKLLNPGTYLMKTFQQETVEILNVAEPFFVPDHDIRLFLTDPLLLEQLTVIDVEDHEYVLHYEDHRFVELLTAGKYAFWNMLKEHRFVRADTRQPAIDKALGQAFLSKTPGFWKALQVASHEVGFLYYDNVLQGELKPGKYYFWLSTVNTEIKTIDMRQQQMDLMGQEIMTEDKITLRLNFVCQYRITDPLRALEFKAYEEQIYIMLQLLLREYVGTMKLDDLLKMKQEIAEYVLTRLNEQSDEYGVAFTSAGVKDIILPGDIKDILNTVLLAEKKAQANLITRREETASTRSLLNTAKLMDENATLYRLKELEFMEKICEKIGTISLTGGNTLLEQLNTLVHMKEGQGLQ
ncbi:slipin family protein [Paenibacillus ottowii]|uniref:Slipin family protein n=1 Tax=Paenibacillus ottowii TaxID=2315729 RepID=A0ABY3B094_9BACL|nr:slipin family protein [Paenibacillus ottowii]TQR97072.1 slipin family protein [Paenibacillus ottowii]